MTTFASSSSSLGIPNNLQRLIEDVKSYQLPALLRDPWLEAPDESADKERELHDSLQRIDAALSAWSMDAVDMGDSAEERKEILFQVQQAKSIVVSLKKQAQQSLIQRHKLKQKKSDEVSVGTLRHHPEHARNALLSDMSASQAERARRQTGRLADQTSDDKLMTTSGDVTAALQRTVKLMSTELEKSSYSAQLLDESTTSVQQATFQYTSFTDLVASSRKLIASMERADLVDAAFLLASMLFFAACILYILKVRIWDRGVGVLTFISRSLGFITQGRSAGDVKEKLRMASEAAKESIKTTSVSTTIADKASSVLSTVSSVAAPTLLKASSSSALNSTTLDSIMAHENPTNTPSQLHDEL